MRGRERHGAKEIHASLLEEFGKLRDNGSLCLTGLTRIEKGYVDMLFDLDRESLPVGEYHTQLPRTALTHSPHFC